MLPDGDPNREVEYSMCKFVQAVAYISNSGKRKAGSQLLASRPAAKVIGNKRDITCFARNFPSNSYAK